MEAICQCLEHVVPPRKIEDASYIEGHKEDQEIIEDLIVTRMCKGQNKDFLFTGIRFRPRLILVDCEEYGELG